jgi:hypothetical protein
MAKRRTWLWILVGVLGLGMVSVIGLAGFGMYFVTRHVHAGPSTSADAFRAFDEARAAFKDTPPVFDLDDRDRPRMVRQLTDLPTSKTRPEVVWLLAWDPDEERLVKLSLPFWMLRLGRQKIDIASGAFDFERMQLDVNELERVGPVLLFDVHEGSGKRVLIWTQ